MKTSLAPFSALEIASIDGARAAISPHGAHLLSWIPRRGGERLYLSGRAQAGPGRTIRGGVPVVFPQFALEGPLPKHGFVRDAPWSLIEHGRLRDGSGHARYGIRDDARTRALWPHPFSAELEATVLGERLTIELRIGNTGDAVMHFTAALHSYLRVADIDDVRVDGLRGVRYRDKVRGDREQIETDTSLAIGGEVDRVYFDAPPELTVCDGERALAIRHAGFADTVVWNPGAGKAAGLKDLDDGGWRRMLCIEAAAVGTPIQLAPGQSWHGSQTLEAR